MCPEAQYRAFDEWDNFVFSWSEVWMVLASGVGHGHEVQARFLLRPKISSSGFDSDSLKIQTLGVQF